MNQRCRASKRRQILARDGKMCWLCGTPMPAGDMTLDHAIPASKGGSNSVDNLRLAHGRCNTMRGNLEAIKAAKPKASERAKAAGAALSGGTKAPAKVDTDPQGQDRDGLGAKHGGAVPERHSPYKRRHTRDWKIEGSLTLLPPGHIELDRSYRKDSRNV